MGTSPSRSPVALSPPFGTESTAVPASAQPLSAQPSAAAISLTEAQHEIQSACANREACLAALFDAVRRDDAAAISQLCELASDAQHANLFSLNEPRSVQIRRPHGTVTVQYTPIEYAVAMVRRRAVQALLTEPCAGQHINQTIEQGVMELLLQAPDAIRAQTGARDPVRRHAAYQNRVSLLHTLLDNLQLRDTLDAQSSLQWMLERAYTQSVANGTVDWGLEATRAILHAYAPLLQTDSDTGGSDIDHSVAVQRVSAAADTIANTLRAALRQDIAQLAALHQPADAVLSVAPRFLRLYAQYIPLSDHTRAIRNDALGVMPSPGGSVLSRVARVAM